MYQSIIIPLLLIVILGSVGIFIISKKRPDQAKQLWTKYFVYLLLMFLNIGLIVWDISIYFVFISVFWFIGLYEIYLITKNKKNLFLTSIIIYFICGLLFYDFISSTNNNTILFFYITILTLDAFSQIFGQLMGKTKITSISPAKTYEGLLGGIVMCIAVGFFISPLIEPNEQVLLITTSLIIGLVGFCGDILASYLKRIADVKDFSKFLPGQGGVLDRYDSWFVCGISFLVLQLFDII